MKVISSFNNKKQFINVIKLETWSEFYQNIYPKRQQLTTRFFSVTQPFLDVDISFKELRKALKKCKCNKASGLDKINNNILKNLPPNWEHYLLNLFNQMLSSEITPEGWSVAEMCMLYKKGDKADPNNYRGISLINTITKLFTTIIAGRLSDWTEENSLIPEEQAGFRRMRGCRDHLFTLATVIGMHVGSKRKSIYIIFVDLKRAFDSVNHQLLWSKLHKIGISGKIIRILNGFYNKAKITVRCGIEHSPMFDITEGVLQGDSLSPLLFILMLSDIVEFFREKNNFLKLNVSKTKVVPFRKTGGCKNLKTLVY